MPNVMFEYDNQVLIDACKGKTVKEEIRGIVLDITDPSKSFHVCDFTWMKHEGNEAAHVVAALMRDGILSGNRIAHPPQAFRASLVKDKMALFI